MVEKPDKKDIQQSSGLWDPEFDARPSKVSRGSQTMARLFSSAILGYLALWAVGFAFVSRVFGLAAAMGLTLISGLPFVVALRLRRRWPDVRRREFVFLAILLLVTSGGVVGLVYSWYDFAMDSIHAEGVRYAEFERLFRRDPAFQNIKLNLSDRKPSYWVSGTVPSEADLNRLKALATQCGIDRERLDGPYVHSVSLTIEGSKGAR